MSESYGRYYDPKKDKRARKTILLTLTTSSGVNHRPKSFITRTKYITRATDLACILCSYCILSKHRCTTQLAKLSFCHSVVSTHSWRFSIIIKRADNLRWKIRNNIKARSPFVCTCGSNAFVKFQVKESQNWAGHRKIAIFSIFCLNLKHLTYTLTEF